MELRGALVHCRSCGLRVHMSGRSRCVAPVLRSAPLGVEPPLLRARLGRLLEGAAR